MKRTIELLGGVALGLVLSVGSVGPVRMARADIAPPRPADIKAQQKADEKARKEAEKAAKEQEKAAKKAQKDQEKAQKEQEKAEKAAQKSVGKMITTPSGLKFVDEKVGMGAQPQKGKMVTVHYTGTLASNGKKFDSSVDRGQPFQFVIGIGQVIAGWDEGVMSMKVGGKRKLMIPAKLGYGERGAGGVIPPNADLNFDVELLGVQ